MKKKKPIFWPVTLDDPLKAKKPPLSNQYIARGTAIRLYTSRAVGYSLKYDLRLFRHLSSFFAFPPAAIPHPSEGSGLWWPQRMLAMCRPFLSCEADPRGEKEQPSSPPSSAFLGYLPETQSAVSERYPPFSRRGGIPASSGFPLRFREGTCGCWAFRLTHLWSRLRCPLSGEGYLSAYPAG